MIELTIEEIKNEQLKILKKVSNFCELNNIDYFLCFGTLLGSIRHKGYIPWDDDIDILMKREDYEKFIESFKDKDYKVESHYLNNDYPYTYAKISDNNTILIEKGNLKYKMGINIDLFPLDKVLKKRNERLKLSRRLMLYHKMLDIKKISIDSKRKSYKNLILLVGKLFLIGIKYDKLIKNINQLAVQNINCTSSYYLACLVESTTYQIYFQKELFDSKTIVEFENTPFFAPQDYDQYLSIVYGDYMTMPPKEMRISHHDFKVYKIE